MPYPCGLPAKAVLTVCLLLFSLPVLSYDPLTMPAPEQGDILTSKIFDGSVTHNVGELQMNITNWGMFGSFPGLPLEMSDAPSAQWPAGSGCEHLFYAEVWLGALVGGIPRVTTAVTNAEFAPERGPLYRIYESFEGDDRGRRYPSAWADDDEDGLTDEDPLNGYDDDGDGLIDEDFAAIGSQILRCSYRDDLPEILRYEPEHNPLGVEVVQESYQWDNELLDDCIGVEFTVFNRGANALEEFFFGFFIDPDVGSRSVGGSYADDLVGFTSKYHCYKRQNGELNLRLQMATAWDADGDAATSAPVSSRFGVLMLGHNTEPIGLKLIEHLNEEYVFKAPVEEVINTWQVYEPIRPFVEGGAPTTDYQRYEALSTPGIDPEPVLPDDYRMLISSGPFHLEPGDSMRIHYAFVAGADSVELEENAFEIINAYEGTWYDYDPYWLSGIYCREQLLYSHTGKLKWADPCSPFAPPINVPKRVRMWVNDDCGQEGQDRMMCDHLAETCTGIGGRETQLKWLTSAPPPPPRLRLWETEHKNVLFWDNFSEGIPDALSDIFDFEGYRIWRADNWNRPAGTTVANGPPSHMWMLLAEYDLINGLMPDNGLIGIRYQPNIDANLVAYYTEVLFDNQRILDHTDHLPPLGYAMADADTAIALARQAMGLPGGKQYYKYEDDNVRSGLPYFYNVTAMDHTLEQGYGGVLTGFGKGLSGDPANGFVYSVPQSASQESWEYDPGRVYVVPNPATPATMAHWALSPNMNDPTGLKVEFRHMPAARCDLRIFTLAGDHVVTLRHDPTAAIANGDLESSGTLAWDLVSRNGQDVCSGVYIFVLEADGFQKTTGKFTVIR